MLWFERLRLLLPWNRRERAQSLEEELRIHEELERADGLRIDPGSAMRVKEIAREVWTFGALERFAQDLRYTLRSLGRAKSFTAVAVLSIALGCAAATAIFSLVDGIVLKPLGYREPGKLVFLREFDPPFAHLYPTVPVNIQHFLYWRGHAHLFESMAALSSGKATLTERGDPERIDTANVSANLFHVLGVEPSMGRAFLPGEDQAGRNNVVIITDSLWRRRFGVSREALNGKILLNGTPYVIVGILPPDFHFARNDDLGPLTQFGKNTEIFRPLGAVNQGWGGDLDYAVIARLAPGHSLEQGVAELNLLQQQITLAHPESRNIRCVGKPLQDTIAAPASRGLYVLLGAVLVLMLIVCVNLANLVFARTNVRARELSIRTALGAGRGRIIRQVLNETLLLGIAGGLLGIAGASAALRAFIAYAPINIPRLDEVQIDWRVVAFSLGLSLIAGLLSGVIPALRIARVDPQDALKAASHNASGSRRDLRMREILVGAEVALSAILLVCGGLLAGSLRQVLHIDRGFAVQRALTFSMQLPGSYKQAPDRVRFFDRLLSSLGEIRGVEAAAFIVKLPLSGESQVNSIHLDGGSGSALDPATREMIFVNVRDISPEYFRAMGMALVKGRIFEQRDREHPVAIVSARLAARLWPDRDPLGQRFSTGSLVGKVEVVGVVQDVHNAKLEKDPTLMVYVPYWRKSAPSSGDIVVRTTIDPLSIMTEVRRRVWSVDPSVPIAQMRTIDSLVSEATSQRRFQMEIVLGFASAALLLALIGIYGVVAYNAAQRRFEMGLRAALGAQPRDLLGLMTTTGLRPILWGLLAGLAGAAACGRLLRGLLYGVSPLDPATLLSVALLLAAAGALACWLPGRAVSRVDPATILRYE
jgi:predicted permease